MKLKNIILTLISGGLLCSCSAVYEDDNLCPQGAEVKLSFRNNAQGTDLFSSEVHCSKILLYDGEGRFFGDYIPAADGILNVDLPLGSYHAIAYGGMSCEEADTEFISEPKPDDHYTDLRTRLSQSRATEVSKQLHPHFHGAADFAVTLEDMDYVPVAIDLTKNTNNFRIVLRYADGSDINAADFGFSISADNAVADYANRIVPRGEEMEYSSFRQGEEDGKAWGDISMPRLMADGEARLKVSRKDNPSPAVEIEILQYLSQIKEMEMKGFPFQDYLDRCDSWTLEFTLDPDTDRLDGLTFTINKWTVVINAFDL